jgi:transposase
LFDAAGLCSHLLGEGSVHAFLAEHRHRLFPDEMFADLFPSGRGRPSVPADVVATVLVLQALESRSDRDACRALQTDIAWKAAAGLALTDEAFHPTVLTLWRNKLRASADPERILGAVRAVIAETGIIARTHRRALDSTVLDDAVARQDTVTMLATQIRRSANSSPPSLRCGCANTTWSPAGHRVIGTTPPMGIGSSPSWSTTRTSWCGRPRASSSPMSRPMRWRCWRWSPARTWSPATGPGAGGSLSALPRTG